MTMIGSRFKTGQICDTSGVYAFDGYADGTWTPAPSSAESRIPLAIGNTFPLIRSASKGCWWKLVQYA